MLLSERKNKRYVIVLDQYDENLGRYIPKSHTVEAPTLVEALISCDHFRQTSTATHPSHLLSVREAKVYPQSFMDADQHNMINVLKELAHNHPDIVESIDEFAETFQSYMDTLNLKERSGRTPRCSSYSWFHRGLSTRFCEQLTSNGSPT